MRKSEIIMGSAVLIVGVLLLLGVIFDIDVWGLICPAGLIALGVWLIYRTRKEPMGADVKIRFVADIRRRGVWQPQSEEIWGFVLDSKLDFTEADLPDGETTYRVGAFVNEIKMTVPTDVGISISSMAFMTEARINGEKEQTFFIPFEWQSDNYASALKKVAIKPICFVAEIKLEHLASETQNQQP